MAGILDYTEALAPRLASTLINRRAAGTATKRLNVGVDNASSRILQTGADLKNLYQTVYAGQQAKLKPYEDVGQQNLDALNAGVKPGGGLADPYAAKAGEFAYTGADLLKDPGYQFGLEQQRRQINAEANVGGIRFSGATLRRAGDRANDYAGTKFGEGFQRAVTTRGINENTFRADQNSAYDKLTGLTKIGQDATGQDVTAGAQYANNVGTSELVTGQQLADLETQRANALAAGDIEKANSITTQLEDGAKALQAIKAADVMKNGITPASTLAPPVAGAAVPLAGATGVAPAMTLAGGAGAAAVPGGLAAAGGGPALAGTGALAEPAIAAPALAAGATAAPLTGYAGGGLVTSHGAMIGMMTNPVTIGVAGAIIGITALIKSQAHHEADDWVQNFQNKFDSGMDQLNRNFQAAAQSGQLSKDQAVQIRNEAQAAMQGYEQKRQEFAKGGSDKKKVAGQALATFNQNYGPGGQDFLGKMDQLIAGLQ